MKCQSLYAQNHYNNGNFGINLGLVAAIGSHFDRFGVNVSTFYVTDRIQINPTFRLYFNARNLGPEKQYVEAVASLGIVYAFGDQDTTDNLFYSPVSNQTHRKNSIGYSYNYYLNNIDMSQFTGTIAFQFGEFSLIAENDLFAQPKLDRFRTGAFLLHYQKDHFQYALNTTLFTGQMGERITDKNYPYNHIYENTHGGKYTQYSHGLLSGQVKYAGPYQQVYQGNLGIDSEWVRHAVQNRLIHDILTFPKITGNTNAHIPMILKDGSQYLFKEDQKVKPPRFFWNAYSNAALFY
ncbi:MAG: hypothetical protein KDD41_04880 [Flavobacteriales bacterium]|nr:hypothetical protein [Flavobacteriales bacterium]